MSNPTVRVEGTTLKLSHGTGMYVYVDKPRGHPQYPNSPEKYSAQLVVPNTAELQAAIKKIVGDLVAPQIAASMARIPGATPQQVTEQLVMAQMLGQNFPVQTITSKDPSKPHMFEGKIRVKGNNGRPPALFVPQNGKYVQVPNETSGDKFYSGAILHGSFSFYMAKIGSVFARLSALYFVEDGTRIDFDSFASADDFEVETPSIDF